MITCDRGEGLFYITECDEGEKRNFKGRKGGNTGQLVKKGIK